ncbi:MAG: hypothetical protein K0R80_176 [Clostridia bacterium]|jgi:hypothetical protein|nr:hypothetical protein [Clostridia bacterium]
MYKKILVFLLIAIFILTTTVSAASGDADFWKLLAAFRKGLFWVGVFSSIYGLYLQMLKRDDMGKKIVITCVLTYIASYVVPNVFVMIDQTFGK